MLHSTLAKTKAQMGVLRRARQLTDFKWTPVRDFPTYTVNEGNFIFPAGEELTGFPYSSVEREDKFIIENISIESFLSAIANPYSRLYQVGHGEHGAPSFGVVCNSFVRYALGISERVSTNCFLTIPGMTLVAEREKYKVDQIELLDVLHAYGNGKNHVEIITDILRNDAGEIEQIELSGAIRPLCSRRCFTVEDFYEKFKLFDLCRYEYIEDIPFDDAVDDLLWHSNIEKKTPKISVNNGNKSNYLVGEEIILSVDSDEADEVELLCDGKLIRSFKVGKKAIAPLNLSRGHYTARLRAADESVDFSVNQAKVTHKVEGNVITICADPCDSRSRIAYMDFRRAGSRIAPLVAYEKLSAEERETGVFSRPIPENAENFKVYYRNEYGVWTHLMTKIF